MTAAKQVPDRNLAMAHELVHAMGSRGHSSGQSELMVTGFDPNNQPGRRLTASQIWAINPPQAGSVPSQ